MIRQLVSLTLVAMAAAWPLQAQAQTKSQDQKNSQAPAKNLVRTGPGAIKSPAKPGPSCDRDGIPAADGQTWCRRASVHQCNASTGKWVNLGKKCT